MVSKKSPPPPAAQRPTSSASTEPRPPDSPRHRPPVGHTRPPNATGNPSSSRRVGGKLHSVVTSPDARSPVDIHEEVTKPQPNPYALPPKQPGGPPSDTGGAPFSEVVPACTRELLATAEAGAPGGRSKMESQTSVDMEPPEGVLDERQAAKLYDELYDAVSTDVTRTEILLGLTQFARRRLQSFRRSSKKQRDVAGRRLDGRNRLRAKPLGMALGQYVKILGLALQLWVVLAAAAGLLVATAAAILFAWGSPLGRLDQNGLSPAAQAPPRAAQPSPQPPGSAQPGPAPEKSVVERAAAGEAKAVAELESRPPIERTAEESAALAQAQVATHLRALEQLRTQFAAQPELVSNREWTDTLRAFVRFERTSIEALLVTAQLPGHAGPDLLHEMWTKADKDSTAKLARQLLLARDVRNRASDALAVALDIDELAERKQPRDCDRLAELLERAIEHGDARCLRPLVRLGSRTGCGADKRQDCYPCLRRRTLLVEAARAVRRRPPPKY
jgi:hypothetical protein